MKKILAIIMLLVMAVACVSCAQTRTAKTPEGTMFTYTLSNETGKTIDKAFVADDNSASKAEVAFTEGGLANGEKVTVSVTAVADKEGNPSLTVSYTIAGSEYMAKVHQKDGVIALSGEVEPAQEPADEGKMFTFTLSNESGKTIDKAFVADDNSASKAEVAFTEGGLANGEKVTVSLTAVVDKDGNPNLTASYTIGGTEYMTKVNAQEGTIVLNGEGETAALQK